MSPAHRTPALPFWHTVSIAVACAAAGGGLRWGFREHDSNRTDSGLTSPAAAVLTKPARALPTHVTAESLRSLSDLNKLTALAAQLPRITVEEIAPLVELLAASRVENWRYDPDRTTDALLVALFTRWAELDAPGMIAALQAPAFCFATGTRQLAVSACVELRGIPALEAVGKQWPGIAESAAWELVARHPAKTEALLPWLRHWSPTVDDETFKRLVGPERYIRIVAAQGLGSQGRTMEALIALDSDSCALRMAKALPPCRIRDEVLLLLGLGSNPREWRAEYETLPLGRVRDELAGGYAGLLEEENPGAGLAWARSLPNGKARGKALQGIADSLLSGGHQVEYFRPTLSNAEKGQAEAADPFQNVTLQGDDSGGSRAEATNFYAEAWLADPAGQSGTARESFEKWRTGDPKSAEAWFQSLTNPALRAALVPPFPNGDPASGQRRDPFDSDATGPAISDEDWVFAAALSEVAATGVAHEEWVAAGTEERRNLSGTMMKYSAEQLAPEIALTFFDSLPPEERSLGAWYEAGRVKISVDLEAASQWMASLPQGPERDAAATALVEYLGSTGEIRKGSGLFEKGGGVTFPAPYEDRDPEAAFTWAADMSGENERVRYMTLAAQAWGMEDAAAARAAVSSANLPEAAKQSLLRQLPEGGTR